MINGYSIDEKIGENAMAEQKTICGIHTKQENLFLLKNIIGIGWKEMGDIKSAGDSRDDIKKKYAEVYPDASAGSTLISLLVVCRFLMYKK